MNLNPRKSIRSLLNEFLLSASNIVIPDPTQAGIFSRYKVVINGWFWGIVPKLSLEKTAEINLSEVVEKTTRAQHQELDRLAEAAQNSIRDTVRRSAANRSGRVRTSLNTAVEQAILGTTDIPSALMLTGRKSVQNVHQSIVTAAGKTSAEQFEKIVRKHLAQMLIYAREEVGTPDGFAMEHSLPMGTRFAFHGKHYSAYIVEEAPRVRTVLWDNTPMKLAFPYTIFVVVMQGNSYDNLFLYFRNKPLKKVEDTLCLATLPDIMSNNHVCYPGPKISKGNHADVVASVQQMFWNSSFTSSHWQTHNRDAFRKIPHFSFEQWLQLSEDDPGAILSVDWPETQATPRVFGKQVVTQQPTPDLKKGLSNLERYVGGIASQVSLQMQEAVVEQIMDSKGPAAARKEFTEDLTKALQDMGIAETAARLIKEHMESSSGADEIAAIVNQAAKRAATELAGIITPSGTKMTTEILESLK